jgi:ABC-type transport system involved in multi-copper enzyme maturation permease subunit
MSPRQVMNVALDVLREAAASKYLIVLFGLIFLGLASLALSLDLEVVNGAISAGKLFGASFIGQGKKVSASEVLGPLMQGVAYAVFLGGLLFLIVAVADIAPKMLAAGRVELLLSLPLRRTELVVGVYIGILLIGLLAATFAIGGASLVLFVKTELTTPAPIFGAIAALVGFATLYGVMLAVAVVGRSAALSAGSAILVYIAGLATSDRQFVLSLIRNGATRELASLVMGPLPRLKALADIGGDAAIHKPIEWAPALSVIGGCTAFGLFFVVVACIVVNVRDY